MDEKTKRLFAGALAKTCEHGGTDLSHSITGIRATPIKLGLNK